MIVRKFLKVQRFRYTPDDLIPNPSPRGGEGGKKRSPGKSDIILPKYKTIIFIHGCFWHGQSGCKYFMVPKTRTKWRTDKINTNKANDQKAVKVLKKEGCKIYQNNYQLVVWFVNRIVFILNPHVEKTER